MANGDDAEICEVKFLPLKQGYKKQQAFTINAKINHKSNKKQSHKQRARRRNKGHTHYKKYSKWKTRNQRYFNQQTGYTHETTLWTKTPERPTPR